MGRPKKEEGKLEASPTNLGHAELRALWRWLEQNEGKIKDKKPSFEEIAEWAAKEVGFAVTMANIRNAVRNVRVINYEPPMSEKAQGVAKINGEVSHLKVRCEALEAGHKELVDEVNRLHQRVEALEKALRESSVRL